MTIEHVDDCPPCQSAKRHEPAMHAAGLRLGELRDRIRRSLIAWAKKRDEDR